MPARIKKITFNVEKRDGRIVEFDKERIITGIFKAAESVGGNDRDRAVEITEEVVTRLQKKYPQRKNIKSTEIADIVKDTLIDMGHGKTSVAFSLFVDLRHQVKNIKSLIDADSLIRDYVDKLDWQVNENSNMAFSWQGLNNYISSTVQSNYWLHSIYPKEIANANINKDMHIHDLGMLATYCCGWSLEDLLLKGFTGVRGKVSSGPAKHFSAALGQCVNFFYTLQHEAAGAQAFSSFDTFLAPFIRYDKLPYKRVKQAMQEFMYNMNVPTRVGCQCVSEDTEILTPDGWKSYTDINEGCTIKTFNLETGNIEDQVVESVFKRKYKGDMYNLKNRIQDQLISPKHRVVRKLFNTDKYILEPIEKVLELKSPVIIPIAGGNTYEASSISDEQIQLMAKENEDIPEELLVLNQRQSELSLKSYIGKEICEDCEILVTNTKSLDKLEILIVNAGYAFTVNEEILETEIRIHILKEKETQIDKVEKINYEGVIWCPHTKNETIVARRNGKVFITGNTPFTNITMDLIPSGQLAEQNVIIGGKLQKEKYKDFTKEMAMLNRAFCEIMMNGDAQGRLFSYPIPTYNLTKDFDWDNPEYKPIWDMTTKYGIPYFSNFINSDMNPDDARSMCCRLRLDNRELRKRGGGLFGANPLTGSVGVVTLNLPRIGFEAKDKKDFFKRLDHMMNLAKKSLIIKRKYVEMYMEKGLYPYSRFYLADVKARFGEYFKNHFNTIGILGLNEAMINFFKDRTKGLASEEGHTFGLEVMDHMREKLIKYQEQTNQLFNLEATPGESAMYKFAKADKKKFGDTIVTAADLVNRPDATPYYTNSSQLPVNQSDDIFEVLDLQDDFQSKYTGGTVLHIYLGEKLSSSESTKNLVKKVATNYTLPYFSITPTFSICPIHGYIAGEHQYCPKCDAENGYVEGMPFEEK